MLNLDRIVENISSGVLSTKSFANFKHGENVLIDISSLLKLLNDITR